MDDFIGVRDVIARERLERLSQRSKPKGLIQLLSHLGGLAVCSYALLLLWGTWWAVPSLLSGATEAEMVRASDHALVENA